MPTEDEARTLLARAGDTIDVDDTVPTRLTGLPEPPRHRWPLPMAVAAAVAVVVAIAAGYVVSRELGGESEPAPSPEPLPSQTPEDEGSPQDEPEISREQAADTFVAWARGNRRRAPLFADEVRLLYQDDEAKVLTGRQSTSPWRWVRCEDLPDPCTGPSALDTLAAYTGDVVQTPSRADMCTDPQADLPDDLANAVDDDLVRLDQPEARNCRDAFAVELWVTDDGEIYAVNLAAAPGLSPLPPALQRLGQDFVAFARGQGEVPATAETVRLFVGSRQVGSFPSAAAPDRQSWAGCPPEGHYAAFSCPFSALDPFSARRVAEEPIQVTFQQPAHVCLPEPYRVPRAVTDLQQITLVPAAGGDCVSYFAVVLAVDESGRIAAANIIKSEP